MCNAYNHPYGCTCGFGGEGHKGNRGNFEDEDSFTFQNGESGPYLPIAERHSKLKKAFSFTIPNAKCPVCGDSVFFYQNEYGSRVFFDELGPPWPKHPCTDNSNKFPELSDEFNEILNNLLDKKIIFPERLNDKTLDFEEFKVLLKSHIGIGPSNDNDIVVNKNNYIPLHVIKIKKIETQRIILGVSDSEIKQFSFPNKERRINPNNNIFFYEKKSDRYSDVFIFDKYGEFKYQIEVINQEFINTNFLFEVNSKKVAYIISSEDINSKLEYIELEYSSHPFNLYKYLLSYESIQEIISEGEKKLNFIIHFYKGKILAIIEHRE